MHILALNNGSIDGNSEIALKAALTAAQRQNPTLTTSYVHIPSVSIPINPKPLQNTPDISLGTNKSILAGTDPNPTNTTKTNPSSSSSTPDDRQALLDALLEADAYIFATPVYSHSPAGPLKAAFDRICGPFTDATFATKILEAQKAGAAGDPRLAQMPPVDPRLLKPRVAAFIAIGGSTTPDQVTMALPMLHTLVYPMHVKVVDQAVFLGVGTPGAIIARDGGGFIRRAERVGRNVASQIGRTFDEAEYLGDEVEGACPYCHLTKVDMFFGRENRIGCLACGARGVLKVSSEDGVVRPVWDVDCGVSSITWRGKVAHLEDIQRAGADEWKEIESCVGFEGERERWRGMVVPRVKLPSQQGV